MNCVLGQRLPDKEPAQHIRPTTLFLALLETLHVAMLNRKIKIHHCEVTSERRHMKGNDSSLYVCKPMRQWPIYLFVGTTASALISYLTKPGTYIIRIINAKVDV